MLVIEGTFNLGVSLYSAWRMLNTHGLASFKKSVEKFHQDALLSGGRMRKEFVTHNRDWQDLLRLLQQVTDKGNNHPKLAKLEQILLEHFIDGEDKDTRAMVFVQYRDRYR
jgi:ERCC4-related helicase